jgi:hypothetical protein
MKNCTFYSILVRNQFGYAQIKDSVFNDKTKLCNVFSEPINDANTTFL